MSDVPYWRDTDTDDSDVPLARPKRAAMTTRETLIRMADRLGADIQFDADSKTVVVTHMDETREFRVYQRAYQWMNSRHNYYVRGQ